MERISIQSPEYKLNIKHTIGIFSRSGKDQYEWLQTLLSSEDFSGHVKDVRPFYISNRNGSQFRELVTQCTFGILYHTKNQGRINVTDVADSLYDDELKYMSEALGKRKVIVIIDDLDSNDSEEHKRILKNQPSIERLAQELILFNMMNKSRKRYITRQDHCEIWDKMMKIKRLL
ncbi:uncharacterized protein O3C94_018736 [Discoglossus pictus]